MSQTNRLLRLRPSLLAALCGWLAGMLFTLPAEATVAWRNTDGQPMLMAQTLALGMVIWGIWTLVFALLGWAVVALPLVLTVSPEWLRARRYRLAVACSLAAVSLPAFKFGLFRMFKTPSEFDQHNFFVYSIFAVSYAVVFLLLYLRLEGS